MIGVDFPHASLNVGLDRGRPSRVGSPVTPEVPAAGAPVPTGSIFSSPQGQGAADVTPVTARQ